MLLIEGGDLKRLRGLAGGSPIAVAGAVATVVAVESLSFTVGRPLAGSGSGTRAGEHEPSLGRYNLLGASLYTVLCVGLLAAGPLRSLAMALLIGALAVFATLSVWLQLAFGVVFPGAHGTGAAAYLTLGVAALSLAALTPPTSRCRETRSPPA